MKRKVLLNTVLIAILCTSPSLHANVLGFCKGLIGQLSYREPEIVLSLKDPQELRMEGTEFKVLNAEILGSQDAEIFLTKLIKSDPSGFASYFADGTGWEFIADKQKLNFSRLPKKFFDLGFKLEKEFNLQNQKTGVSGDPKNLINFRPPKDEQIEFVEMDLSWGRHVMRERAKHIDDGAILATMIIGTPNSSFQLVTRNSDEITKVPNGKIAFYSGRKRASQLPTLHYLASDGSEVMMITWTFYYKTNHPRALPKESMFN